MKYKFVGEGTGVPGLPHELTDEEALELGVVEILEAALANGNYVAAADEESSSAAVEEADDGQ